MMGITSFQGMRKAPTSVEIDAFAIRLYNCDNCLDAVANIISIYDFSKELGIKRKQKIEAPL